MKSYIGPKSIKKVMSLIYIKIVSLQSTITSHATSITTLTNTLKTTNSNVSVNSADITTLQNSLSTANTNISTNKSSITSLQTSLNSLITRVAALESYTEDYLTLIDASYGQLMHAFIEKSGNMCHLYAYIKMNKAFSVETAILNIADGYRPKKLIYLTGILWISGSGRTSYSTMPHAMIGAKGSQLFVSDTISGDSLMIDTTYCV